MARQVKLDEIVREFLLSQETDSMHKYPIYLQHAIRGLKSCDYDVSGIVRVAKLDLSATNSATLPSDFVKAVRFVMLNNDGRVTEIYKDDSILPNPDTDVTVGSTGSISFSVNQNPSSVFRNGEFVGADYGHGGGSVYSMNIDYTTSTVVFSSNVGTPVYCMYIADPKRVNGEYLVHPFLVEPILKFIYYASIRFNKSISRNEKDAAFRDFLNAKHHANVQFASESAGHIINASRKTFSQAPKM